MQAGSAVLRLEAADPFQQFVMSFLAVGLAQAVGELLQGRFEGCGEMRHHCGFLLQLDSVVLALPVHCIVQADMPPLARASTSATCAGRQRLRRS